MKGSKYKKILKGILESFANNDQSKLSKKRMKSKFKRFFK
jgi:hypothetical protein